MIAGTSAARVCSPTRACGSSCTAPSQRYTARIAGTTCPHAASRSSTSARVNPASHSPSSAVTTTSTSCMTFLPLVHRPLATGVVQGQPAWGPQNPGGGGDGRSVRALRDPYDDGDRARGFYSEAFGWQLQSMPGMDYTLVSSGPSGDNGPT